MGCEARAAARCRTRRNPWAAGFVIALIALRWHPSPEGCLLIGREQPLEDVRELPGREGLGEEDIRQAAGAAERLVAGAVAAHERDRQVWPVDAELARERHAVLEVEPHVEENGVDSLLGQEPHGAHAVLRLEHAVALEVENVGDERPQRVAVLDHENRGWPPSCQQATRYDIGRTTAVVSASGVAAARRARQPRRRARGRASARPSNTTGTNSRPRSGPSRGRPSPTRARPRRSRTRTSGRRAPRSATRSTGRRRRRTRSGRSRAARPQAGTGRLCARTGRPERWSRGSTRGSARAS